PRSHDALPPRRIAPLGPRPTRTTQSIGPAPSVMALLDIRNLTMRFGGLTAVDRVNLQVEPGQVFSVIGPNGAGKTTVFNAITGIYDPTEGSIQFGGQALQRRMTWRLPLLAAIVGLTTALAAVAFSVDIDGLWHATILRNYDFDTHYFDAREAWHDLG